MKTVLSIIGISPRRIGGQEAFAREFSRQLGELGWQSVLCFSGVPPANVREYLELPNTKLDVMENPERSGWGSILQFCLLLRRYRPEMLQLYYTSPLSLFPWLARVCLVSKIFFTDQASRPVAYVPRPAATWKRCAGRAIIWPLSGWISASSYGASCAAIEGYVPRALLKVIHNSVDLSLARPDPQRAHDFRRRYGIPEKRDLVVQVSWLIPQKGVPDTVEAARIVISKWPNAHFAFVGDGAFQHEYQQLAAGLGIAEHMTWTGLVEDPMRGGVYEAADIVCQPSRWEEMFGYVIAEAMASSRPVVATRVGGIPEVVEDGVTGFIVPSEKPHKLAEKILQLMSSADLREAMGRAGRKRVEEKFDVRVTAAEAIRFCGLVSPPLVRHE